MTRLGTVSRPGSGLDHEVAIRPARAEDAGAISALINSLFRYFLSDPDRPEDAEAFFRKISVAGIAETLADARFRYHVAEAEGVLAGVVGMRDAGHLYHLFVAEPFHGRGIAARLWDTVRREARAQGNPGRFTVNSSRYAIPVYERLGFAATDTLQVMDGLAYLPMELIESDPSMAAGGSTSHGA